MKIILPRQTTAYTCGPTTLSAVARILGKPIDEDVIADALDARAKIGTAHHDMEEWAVNNLPVSSFGSDSYEGGLSIANIQNKDSGNGHYVLFLGQKDGTIRYYCPHIGRMVEQNQDELCWQNGDGSLKNWSINFDVSADFYNLDIRPEQHVFFLGDALDSLDTSTDTSLVLMQGYNKRDRKASWHIIDDVFIRGEMLYLSGFPVFSNDLVWIRLNPDNNIRYFSVLQQLCHVKAIMLNSAQSIMTCNDKKLTTEFREKNHVFTVFSRQSLAAAINHLNRDGATSYVIKPPGLFGGQDVHITKNIDELEKHFDKILAHSGCAIIEKYIVQEHDLSVDTSVLVTWDRIIGAVKRTAKDKGSLTPWHQGAFSEVIKGLSSFQISTISKAQEMMRQKGIFIAGFDFLDDELIEINISCPGGVTHLNNIYKTNVESEIIKSADLFRHCEE